MQPAPPTAQQVASFQYVLLTSLVLVSWELLVHFFQDLAYFRMKDWYRRPVLWAYFIQRYGAFAVVVAQANIRLGTPPSCYSAGMASLVIGSVFVLPSISLIYLYRVLAIWNKRPVIKYTLIVLWVVSFGASITAPFSQTAGNLPNGKCTIIRSERYTPASFIANAVYDGIIFVLTLVKLGANRRQYKNFRSPVQTILLRDGILYFAVAVIVGITDIVFLEAVKSPVVASTVIPLHIALTSIMTTRLVNNVFQVVTDGSSGVHFVSDSRVDSDGVPRNPTGGMSGKIQSSKRRQPANTATISSFTIGSGVGTDYLDEEMKLPHGDLENPRMADESRKGVPSGSQTYNVPMTPTKSGVHVKRERRVIGDESYAV